MMLIAVTLLLHVFSDWHEQQRDVLYWLHCILALESLNKNW